MPLILQEEVAHFETMIYLPMVLIILERDRTLIEKGSFKLERPYLELVEGAIKQARKELIGTKLYMRKRHMKLLKGIGDDIFTEYIFYHEGWEEHRRYLNIRLRNHVEELLRVYLAMSYNEI